MRIFGDSPYVLLTLGTLFWAGNTVVGRAAHTHIPAFSLSFWRWVVAFCCILPLGWGAVRKDWDYFRTNWVFMLVLGVMSVTAYNTFLYWALTWTSAINVSVVCATMPLVIFLFSWIIGGQKATSRQSGGVLLALTGVLIVISRGDPWTLLHLNINWGDGLALISVLCFGLYSILVKQAPVSVNPVGFITVCIFWGLVGIAPFYAWDMTHAQFFVLDSRALAMLLYVGVFPSLLAFFFWNKALAKGGASVAGMFFNLIPVFTTLLAVFFLGETLTNLHIVGMVLIFCGIYLATFFPRPVSAQA